MQKGCHTILLLHSRENQLMVTKNTLCQSVHYKNV